MRVLLVGGGCRGLDLTRLLVADGHAVRLVTRDEGRRASVLPPAQDEEGVLPLDPGLGRSPGERLAEVPEDVHDADLEVVVEQASLDPLLEVSRGGRREHR